MASPDPEERSRLGLTRPLGLVFAALAGAAGSLVLVLLSQRVVGFPPLLPWTGPLVLLFVAAIIAALAFTTWRRVQVRREQIEARRGITYLALGKASALGGAAIAAGYLVFVFLSADNLAAAGPQQRVVRGLIAALAGVLIGAAGLWLERACVVPDPPDETENEESGQPERE
ncbi:MAG TPA: DUF3180 domain-containing protein [Propionibacterium sp.]|nr:DUF3180 domain-containing protein [Propionibacterium sp.]